MYLSYVRTKYVKPLIIVTNWLFIYPQLLEDYGPQKTCSLSPVTHPLSLPFSETFSDPFSLLSHDLTLSPSPETYGRATIGQTSTDRANKLYHSTPETPTSVVVPISGENQVVFTSESPPPIWVLFMNFFLVDF